MPDITMCLDDECPLRECCYRYMAKPSEPQQAYELFDWNYQDDKFTCEHFGAIEDGK